MLLDLLFPKKCLGCGEFGRFICSDCAGNLAENEQLICPVCRENSFSGESHKKCEGRYTLDGFFCFWQYKGLAQKLIKNLKYRFVRSEVEEVVDLATNQLRNTPGVNQLKETSEVDGCHPRRLTKNRNLTFLKFLETKPIIIPVPLHKLRENWRGFNQAALLGKEFAKRFGFKFSDKILERIKDTRPQVELRGKKRRENIKGVFALSEKIHPRGEKILHPGGVLRNRNFLLVDDVWTTGSTLRECAKVLKKAGAGKIWALTLAR